MVPVVEHLRPALLDAKGDVAEASVVVVRAAVEADGLPLGDAHGLPILGVDLVIDAIQSQSGFRCRPIVGAVGSNRELLIGGNDGR